MPSIPFVAERLAGAGRLPSFSAIPDHAASSAIAYPVHVDAMLRGTSDEFGFRQILLTAGIPTYPAESCEPVIYYGCDPRVGTQAAVWIQSRAAEHLAGAEWSVMNGMPVPMGSPVEDATGDGRRIPLDLGALCAFWMNLESERNVAERDEHGRILSSQSLLGRLGLLERPPVHAYAEILRRRMEMLGFRPPSIDRWPGGKRWAVVITHDVDEPESPRAAYRHVQRIFEGPNGKRREAYWDLRAELRSRGLAEGLFAGAEGRREWDFDAYCRVESDAGLRSTFYFSVVPKSWGHGRDVTYDLGLPRYRQLMARLQRSGWETGLHASYETIEDRPALKWQVRRLTSLARDVPTSMRHHYLRLDPRRPYESIQSASTCGLMCDSSVGFNDAPGFRAGIAMPYRVHGALDSTGRRVFELPMTLADMHLPRNDVATATRIALAHVAAVRELGGMAVLNWHVGNWHSKPAWRESFKAVCELLASDSTVWTPTVAQAAAWVSGRPDRNIVPPG